VSLSHHIDKHLAGGAMIAPMSVRATTRVQPAILQPAEPFRDDRQARTSPSLDYTTDAAGREFFCARSHHTGVPTTRVAAAGRPTISAYLGPVFSQWGRRRANS